MIRKLKIDDLKCLCAGDGHSGKIAYILYPMDILKDWAESSAEKYGVTIVVITGMDWETVFSPWPAKGVPKGSSDFKGESPEFLDNLKQTVIPKLESALGVSDSVERTLIGVSMSGLFALWQWMLCDIFKNIASLSGSFWYEGFLEWFRAQPIPKKSGEAFFLLGDQESKSSVKAFNSVGAATRTIVGILKKAGIKVAYESVPGDHFSNPIPRLDAAFAALF